MQACRHILVQFTRSKYVIVTVAVFKQHVELSQVMVRKWSSSARVIVLQVVGAKVEALTTRLSTLDKYEVHLFEAFFHMMNPL